MTLGSIMTFLTGRQHFFKVKLTYYPDPRYSEQFVSKVATIGLTDRSDIANERLVKKALVGPMISNYIKGRYKLPGAKSFFQVDEVYYLGFFAPPKQFTKLEEPEAKKLASKFSTKAALYRALSIINFLATGAMWIAAFIIGLVIWSKLRG